MSLLTLMLKRMYWYAETLQDALAQNGLEPLTRAQTFVIANIASGEHHASKIAKNLGVSRQAISLVLIELVNRGYVAMQDDANNRSYRVVDFAPGFVKKGEICLKLVKQLDAELARRIGKKTLQNFREALEAEWGAPPVLRLPGKSASRLAEGQLTASRSISTRSKQKAALERRRNAE
jgi:DNA-binding MarR family transcriptional regulator